MKLDVNLDELLKAVDQMGATHVSIDLGKVWNDSVVVVDGLLESCKEADKSEVHNNHQPKPQIQD